MYCGVIRFHPLTTYGLFNTQLNSSGKNLPWLTGSDAFYIFFIWNAQEKRWTARLHEQLQWPDKHMSTTYRNPEKRPPHQQTWTVVHVPGVLYETTQWWGVFFDSSSPHFSCNPDSSLKPDKHWTHDVYCLLSYKDISFSDMMLKDKI